MAENVIKNEIPNFDLSQSVLFDLLYCILRPPTDRIYEKICRKIGNVHVGKYLIS